MLLGQSLRRGAAVDAFGAKSGRDGMHRKAAFALVVEHRQRQRMHGGGKRHLGRSASIARSAAVRCAVRSSASAAEKHGRGAWLGVVRRAVVVGWFFAFMSSGRMRPRSTASLPS